MRRLSQPKRPDTRGVTPRYTYPRKQLLSESVMKPSAILLLTSALLTVSALAQNAASPAPATTPHITGMQSTAAHSNGWPWSLYASTHGCPIGLRAQQGSGAGMVVTQGLSDHGPEDRLAQRLHLSLTNLQEHSIIGVTLTAYGLTATTHRTPVSPAGGAISRTLHLDLSLDPRADTAADLTFDAFTSVSRIDLVAIDYADGASWHAPATEPCSVTPELFMLVSSR